ncbi:MAG: hypothetical protein LWW94_09240 [Candidatus Desulfofervidaceae bacterium]|nr:hypothetical protein [Candidatus Desulfofervidaceae bacterium]
MRTSYQTSLKPSHQKTQKNQILLRILVVESLLDKNYPVFSTFPAFSRIYISLHLCRRLFKAYSSQKTERKTDFQTYVRRNIRKNHTFHTIQLLWLDLIRSKFQKIKSHKAHCVLRAMARIQAQAGQGKEYISTLQEEKSMQFSDQMADQTDQNQGQEQKTPKANPLPRLF